ncbi:MAG: stage III sporulation protein AE, partial [Firmicutes bacterium]|nr:stage III sporulation protein AE [Bacillota bacterium]
MRSVLIGLCALIFVLWASPVVFAQGLDAMVKTQAQSVNTRQLDQEVSRLVAQYPQIQIPSAPR